MRSALTGRVCSAALALVAAGGAANAQPASNRSDPSRKFEIVDNSFLVEESFNQDPGVFQNIFTWTRSRQGDWQASFTQEWPLSGVTHQFSYTIPFSRSGEAAGLNDVLLNYRYQLTHEAAGRPAISPRFSLIVPTGRERDQLGSGVVGFQVAVPASKQFDDLYVHVNGGGTWLPGVDWTPYAAGSGVWRMTPMFSLMLETMVEFGESATVSPGFRRGWNAGTHQIVVGAALPVIRADGRSTVALLAYLSYELPFR